MKNSFTTRLIAAAALAGCMTWSSAGIISVGVDAASPFSVGRTVTFTVSDSNPRDMYMVDPSTGLGLGLVAGDFSFLYDPAVLAFIAVAYPSWITGASNTFALDNGSLPPIGEVLVTIAGIDESELPATPDDLFHVSFVVKHGAGGSVSVSPYLGDPPADGPSYAFAPASQQFAINAVPLPSTAALVALGLLAAGMATRRSRCPTRS